MELKHYKEKVQKILEDVEDARNNDGVLIAHFINRYCKQLVEIGADGKPTLPLRNFRDLPPLENIRRSRAIIQNDNQILRPTKPEVLKGRRMKEESYRNAEIREAKLW